MTEDEARLWIADRYGVPRETLLSQLATIVLAENERQNLIAPSTVGTIWHRHIVDSAQLLTHAESAAGGVWLDIGSGAGFPGMVVAALCERPVVLVEPRRLRAEFLVEMASLLGLANVEVRQAKVERLAIPAAVISARAVAPATLLFAQARRCATNNTLWLLPKGRNVAEELAEASRAWHGVFHVEPSLTSSDSAIIVAKGVSPR